MRVVHILGWVLIYHFPLLFDLPIQWLSTGVMVPKMFHCPFLLPGLVVENGWLCKVLNAFVGTFVGFSRVFRLSGPSFWGVAEDPNTNRRAFQGPLRDWKIQCALEDLLSVGV